MGYSFRLTANDLLCGICVVEYWPETRCSSMIEHQLMMQWVIGSIPHGEPVELYLIPAYAPQVV